MSMYMFFLVLCKRYTSTYLKIDVGHRTKSVKILIDFQTISQHVSVVVYVSTEGSRMLVCFVPEDYCS